jgi:hypothetical protein
MSTTLTESKLQSNQEHDLNAMSPVPETWAASRALEQEEQKELMARHFADHDFLVRYGQDPATTPRESVASILVNQGTSPNVVVREALKWIEKHAAKPPLNRVFHITWYSPGALVPATLHEFRQSHPHLSAATHVHLFPGEVDLQLQAMISKEAQDYARKIQRRFSYMVLSGYSFDLDTGEVRFQFDREIPIQKTCALLNARHKFLFFDSRKFTGEGEIGYSLAELLVTSTDSVTIYTVASSDDDKIKAGFEELCGALLDATPSDRQTQPKSLRLIIIGADIDKTTSTPRQGYLRPRLANAPTALVDR